MICDSCKTLRPINICTDSIEIGTVASINSTYNIYFISLANGLIVRYTTISDANGLLILTPTSFVFATNHLYKLFVNQTNSVERGEDLTIGVNTAKCFNIEFVEVKDFQHTVQTLEVA